MAEEGIQFYRISRGSLYELKDHLISCYDLGYIKDELSTEGIKLIEEAKITLNGFINFVKKQIKK
jgi:four helix bundle protein